MNFTENWSCRGLSIVRGRPKFAFGFAGINRLVPIGVLAKLPTPGMTGQSPIGQETAPRWMVRVVESLYRCGIALPQNTGDPYTDVTSSTFGRLRTLNASKARFIRMRSLKWNS